MSQTTHHGCERNFREQIIDSFYDLKSVNILEELKTVRDQGDYWFDSNNNRLIENFIIFFIKKDEIKNLRIIVNILCNQKNFKIQLQMGRFFKNLIYHETFIKNTSDGRKYSSLEHNMNHDYIIVNKIFNSIKNKEIPNKNVNMFLELLNISNCNCIGL